MAEQSQLDKELSMLGDLGGAQVIPNTAPVNVAPTSAQPMNVQPQMTGVQQNYNVTQPAQVQQAQTYAQPQYAQPMPANNHTVAPSPVPMQNNVMEQGDQVADEFDATGLAFGQAISNFPVEKVKGVKDQSIRFGILFASPNPEEMARSPFAPYAWKIHYDEEVGGSFKCFGGECCQLDSKGARTRIVLPIVLYPTLPNDPYTIIPGKKAELKILVLGNEAWTSISNKIKSKGFRYENFDIIGTCTDGQYNSFDFTATDDTFRAQQPDFEQVKQSWLKVRNVSYKAVGKILPRETYLQLKGLGPYQYQGGSVGQDVPDLNDIGV